MARPSASTRSVTTPIASTDGTSSRVRSRSSRYSCRARCSSTSLTAYTSSPTPDEADHVPGDAAGQRDQLLLGPLLQRRRPGQGDQLGDGLAAKNLGTRLILSSSARPLRPSESTPSGRRPDTIHAPKNDGPPASLRGAESLAQRENVGDRRSPVSLENTCTCAGSIFSRTVSPRWGGVVPWMRAVSCWAVISSSSGMPAKVP